MKLKSHPMLHAARLFTAFALLATPLAAMPSEGDTANLKTVDQDVQALKKQLIELNRDLFKLEEELLYPASTQVAVFLSVDVGTFLKASVRPDDQRTVTLTTSAAPTPKINCRSLLAC